MPVTTGRPDNMPFDGSVYGNGTTTATSGANTITHFYDRMGIKAATDENILHRLHQDVTCLLSMVKHIKYLLGYTS